MMIRFLDGCEHYISAVALRKIAGMVAEAGVYESDIITITEDKIILAAEDETLIGAWSIQP